MYLPWIGHIARLCTRLHQNLKIHVNIVSLCSSLCSAGFQPAMPRFFGAFLVGQAFGLPSRCFRTLREPELARGRRSTRAGHPPPYGVSCPLVGFYTERYLPRVRPPFQTRSETAS